MKWYFLALSRFLDFSGRARRMEYWMFALFNFAIAFCLGLIEGFAGLPAIISSIYSLLILLPGIAVTVRRLHDTGKTGWWILIAFVPLLGVLILLLFMATPGTPGSNQYGANPKEVGED